MTIFGFHIDPVTLIAAAALTYMVRVAVGMAIAIPRHIAAYLGSLHGMRAAMATPAMSLAYPCMPPELHKIRLELSGS